MYTLTLVDRTAIRLRPVLAGLAALFIAACGGGGGTASPPPPTGGGGGEVAGRVFRIQPGPEATTQMVAAMVQARPRDVIEFGCGYFELGTGFALNGTEDIRVRGCGINETVLSFKTSNSQEGFLATNVRGLVAEGFTVLDSPGDAFKLKGVDVGTLRRVRAIWSSGRNTADEDTITAENFRDKLQVACTQPARENPANPASNPANTTSPDYTVSVASGRYGIYPVESRNILVEEAESIGASDAGIYVGQTTKAIIRNSRAAYNVFGFEIENVQGGEYANNIAECNTGGFLVYDLDGLTQYGKRARVHGNIARNNNSYNFAQPGTIVANVPRGSGLITLAYDQIDIFNNSFENNDTGGIIVTSYEVLGVPGDRRLDMYSEGIRISGNRFKNNGNNLPAPDFATIVATGGEQVSTAFPMIVGLKSVAGGGDYRGAHLVWDGLMDSLDAECPYPVDANGRPVPADEDGKPILSNADPNPACRYNAYKFKPDGSRITPKWWFNCVEAGNQFEGDSEDYLNFNGLRGLEAVFAASSGDPIATVTSLPQLVEFPGSFEAAENDCLGRFGANLPPLAPIELEPFVPSDLLDPAPSEETVARLCGTVAAAGQINGEAALRVNCPRLDQYQLFADPADPTSLPRGQGIPYVLNSKLFTDYAVKHRVVFLPPGQPAVYRATGEDISSNGTLLFPVGTVIAKTFSFVEAGVQTPYETRLLIKRQRAPRADGSPGAVYWDALEYIWREENGSRVALFSPGGGQAAASWDFEDVDSGVRHQGSTPAYLFPNINQCLICHANDDNETGSAPIGPKVRNLNRAYVSESPVRSGSDAHPVAGRNQIAWWCANGFLANCPADLGLNEASQVAQAIERIPVFNIPGDAGFPAGSKADIEARARAYLEINCAHCHNERGQASNTGFYVDVFRPVNATYGICKGPTATGSEGRGGRLVDIFPGDAAASIVPYRIGPEATAIAARMPPLARSVVHDEAFDLLSQWIDTVVDETYEDADACPDNGGPLGIAGHGRR
ncbi:MAG TPA: parallel beta-helix domain-containing protein [Nevskiaceae bacterium]|nr:parallel beta-helix domain-containing protein [Nevskiaceae bacterium]